MSHYVYCLAADEARARAIVEGLYATGIGHEYVSILSQHPPTTAALASDLNTLVPQGSFAGANVGGAIGWLAGLTALTIPGIGLFVAAGPIVGFIAGIALGASLGNKSGALIEEMGIPDETVALYEAGMTEGKIIITTQLANDAWNRQALDTMRDLGGENIGSTVEQLLSHTQILAK
jgi:hypothetical protein